MKKVLIWDLNYVLKNSGGPAGYLYNIREYLLKHPTKDAEIHFLKDDLGIPNVDRSVNTYHKDLMKKIHKLDILSLMGYFRTFRCLMYWNKKLSAKSISGINLNDFDAIHFHNSGDLYRASELLRSYEGKIILTTHSPQPKACEDVENIVYKWSVLRRLIKKQILKKELQGWEKADYIMFPVQGALEPYYVEKEIKDYKDCNTDKFIYCESSILDKPISKPLDREELGIDSSKYLICYLGRHNEIKGYDQLKLFAEHILSKDSRFEFVIAGNEEPLTRLDHPNWKELGWINYGNRLVSSSDIFILPNKETYFDLVTLEVMREGIPILMSRTGGNKFFERYGEEYGIFLYNYGDIKDQEAQFNKMIYELENGILKVKAKKLRNLFIEHFTMEHYISRYIETVKNIC